MFNESGSTIDPVEAPGAVPPAAPPPASRPRRPLWQRPKVVLPVVLVLLTFLWLAWTAPLSRALEPLADPTLLLVSADGVPIARRGAVKERPVVASDLPKYVPGAFVAIEDRRFYSHWGIDPRGILRAAWTNLRAGGVVQGGSTITQQLAKTAFLSADQNMGRKARELLIAFWLEAWLTKDEILSRYLSSIYFGDGVYGLRAAARHYFDVPPERLSVAQAAMLAGMVKAPSRLAPTRALAAAQARSRLVLAAMVENDIISPSRARVRPARVRRGDTAALPTGGYFADWVSASARDSAEADYGETRVATTLDAGMQKQAERVIARWLAGEGARLHVTQAALVAMRPDGRVVAMVGGRDYRRSPFNRATQARRQPGSAFKTFVYLAAMRAGYTPDSDIEDTPLTIGKWSPANYDRRYQGTINLRQAFAESSNVAAVRLSEAVGRDRVIRAARDLGITSPLADSPALALGTSTATLLEMTSAYAGIAGGTYPVRPRGLPAAADPGWRERLWSSQRRLDRKREWPAMLDLLGAAATRGTGRAAYLGVPTFGKTGTTQDHRDAVFIGFAGDLVTGIWVGNDDNSPMDKVTGGGLPARMWRDFMSHARLSEHGAAPRPAVARAPVVVDRTPIEEILPEIGGEDLGDAVARTRAAIEDARAAQAAIENFNLDDILPPPPPRERDREPDRDRRRGDEPPPEEEPPF
ncbi:transglycosylase domain-containing protein [Sphingomonas solaris]|uniref:transglycosylase domain-containing protein n=1 Tax=Alterirhizorhabdus solaris TaxID=2529389 RepID=UPI001EEFB0F9|nr:PBP1A family penicillin-binding protein [Sphingomonas solaris]